MSAALVLPNELTIYSVAELRPAWLDALAGASEDTLEVDAAGVEEIDAAGAQLLAALQRSAAAQGRTLRLCAPSERLRGACVALGLDTLVATAAPEAA